MVTSTSNTSRLEPPEPSIAKTSLGSLLISFLKIGSTGFGGGMAVIALMEEELVRKRRLIPLEEFIHGIALGQGLGAFAVNVAIFTGYRLFGVSGALLSAGVFLTPSVVLVMVLSEMYFRYHAIPAMQSTVAGLSPVVVGLVLSAAWSTGRRSIHSWPTAAIGLAAFVAGVWQVNAAWILLAAGGAGFLLSVRPASPVPMASPSRRESTAMPAMLFAAPVSLSLSPVIGTFLQVGMVFFGGGFVLVPILHSRLVSELGWLTPQEFLDGLAISNLAPGPVALLATFAGYHLGGPVAALEATVALFAPGVLLMLVISREYGRLRNDPHVQRFLAGVNPAVAGLIASAAPQLAHGGLVSSRSYALLILSFGLLVIFRWHPAFVLAVGAVAGYFKLLP